MERRPGIKWPKLRRYARPRAVFVADSAAGDRPALTQAAFDQMSQPAAIFDHGFRLVSCNPAAARLLALPDGLTQPGTPMRQIILHQAAQGAFTRDDAEARIRDLGQRRHVRMEYQRHDGRVVMVRRDPLEGGGFIVLYNDMTEQRQAESALQENERRYYAVVEDQADLIVRFAPDGRITFVNGACCRFYGRPRQELLGSDVLDLVHPDDRRAVGTYFRVPGRPHRVRTLEHRAIHPDGESARWLERSDRPIYDAADVLIEFQSVMRDVTDLKRAQEQAHRVGKLTALGQIVAGVTHELNQPLNAAALATQNALLSMERRGTVDAGYIKRKLEALVDDLLRMGQIVNHLRTFMRPSGDTTAAADVVAAVRRTTELVDRQFGFDAVVFDLQLPDSCRPVAAAAIDIETVLVNLFTNARDAIVRLRSVDGASAEAETGQGRIVVQVEDMIPENEIRIVVRDNGGGIPDELIPRVFDPFVTTKEVGSGMGLGLSIVHQTVANLGGRLDVHNAHGGAEFRVWIPVARSGS